MPCAAATRLTTDGLAFASPASNPLLELTTTYTTNELNQYPQITRDAGDETLVYDLDGNLTNDGTFQYVYDAENRLISVTPLDTTSGLKKTEFAYDYKHRRVKKTVSQWLTDQWFLLTEHEFVYDGWNLIREQETVPGAMMPKYYVWGLDLSGTFQGAGGIGGLLSTTNSLTAKTYLYTFDANGNVGQLVDAADGTIAVRYEYDPFGNLLVTTGPEAENNPFRFSTKYFDVETGLYYYGYRYYSPELGRWMTRDPIEERGGVNFYGFVENNPVIYFDELGLKISVVQIIRGRVSDGMYGWDYQYRQEGCSVTIRIKLIDQTPPPYLNDPIIETWRRHPEEILKRWETAAEEKWSNKFACCDPDGFTNQRLCCKGLCIITLDVQLVTSGEDTTVNVHHGWSRMYPGYPSHTDRRNWWLIDSGDEIAHEIGHQLGLKDEYLDLGLAPNRYPVNTGTVMDNNRGPAVLRHFKGICSNIGKIPTSLRGTGLE